MTQSTNPRWCYACLGPAEGNYSVHSEGYGRGPEVPLCDACGGAEGPSCEELWRMMRAGGSSVEERLAARTIDLVDDPMLPWQVAGEAASWGSFNRAGDPGACMYRFDDRGLVQGEAHRQACLSWIDTHCLPLLQDLRLGHSAEDADLLRRLRRYISTAPCTPEGA